MANDDDLFIFLNTLIINKGDQNITSTGSLEDRILGIRNPQQIQLIDLNPPHFSLFESDYQKMRDVAVEEDDFTKVLNIFGSILERSYGMNLEKTKTVLQEAYLSYVRTQQQLAQMFAEVGHFELTDAHLKNAHSGYDI
ncbi:TPA: hypothetical protein HA241_02345 [Candidatus Woesearchaeota archaeon]|nr:hypothetical protein [Candidatus Woesearchaeota archaeon]